MTLKIATLVFPGFQLLDAAGPLAAFGVANEFAPRTYELQVIAADAGTVLSSCGVPLAAQGLRSARGLDTLLVCGGLGTRAAVGCARTRRFVARSARTLRRTASICSGAYVLAAAGLLEGRRATTHWRWSEDFRRHFPGVRLEPDRIFVRQGRLWTSAGISAAIDLSLALIEQDLGEALARRVAQEMVVYYRRPGGQSQFSAMLELEQPQGRFAALLEHVRLHLTARHSVEDLARRACMSARQFHRAFQAETGLTPAQAVERLRRTCVRLYGLSPAALKRGAPMRN